jgi:hypothetical protein
MVPPRSSSLSLDSYYLALSSSFHMGAFIGRSDAAGKNFRHTSKEIFCNCGGILILMTETSLEHLKTYKSIPYTLVEN